MRVVYAASVCTVTVVFFLILLFSPTKTHNIRVPTLTSRRKDKKNANAVSDTLIRSRRNIFLLIPWPR